MVMVRVVKFVVKKIKLSGKKIKWSVKVMKKDVVGKKVALAAEGRKFESSILYNFLKV